MASLPEKAVSLGVALVATGVLLNLVTEKLGTGGVPRSGGTADDAVIAVAAAVAALGFIGQRWFVRRFVEPRTVQPRVFAERRRAEPPPPDFHAE